MYTWLALFQFRTPRYVRLSRSDVWMLPSVPGVGAQIGVEGRPRQRPARDIEGEVEAEEGRAVPTRMGGLRRVVRLVSGKRGLSRPALRRACNPVCQLYHPVCAAEPGLLAWKGWREVGGWGPWSETLRGVALPAVIVPHPWASCGHPHDAAGRPMGRVCLPLGRWG